MPEISICIFDLKLLFRLFPKKNSEFQKQFFEYEQNTNDIMAENRERLFAQ